MFILNQFEGLYWCSPGEVENQYPKSSIKQILDPHYLQQPKKNRASTTFTAQMFILNQVEGLYWCSPGEVEKALFLSSLFLLCDVDPRHHVQRASWVAARSFSRPKVMPFRTRKKVVMMAPCCRSLGGFRGRHGGAARGFFASKSDAFSDAKNLCF